MSKMRRITTLWLGVLMVAGMSLPQPLVAQTSPSPSPSPPASSSDPAPTGKTMADYVAERGFYEPNGAYIDDKIAENRANFDLVRDYATKFAPKAGADPVLVVWWAFLETGAPVSPYTWNNCHNKTDYPPDYLCKPEAGLSADDWQIAYGQQYNVAYNHLVDAFEAVYGNPTDRQKVQQVIQKVIDEAGLSITAPSNLTVADLQENGRHGEAKRLWAMLLSRDPGISVYLLSTALVHFDRDEAFGYPGTFYQDNWQNYSNALNDVLQAWGKAGALGSTGSGAGFGPTEPPIELEVPDCPGVVREINAFNLPPSIYPKPNCGGGTPGAGVGTPSGEFGTDTGAPAANTLFWAITNGTVYPIAQGYGLTDYGTQEQHGIYEYCNNYDVPGHCGVDVDTPLGTPVFAPLAGEVICDGTSTSRGGDEWENCSAFDNETVAGPYKGRFEMKLDNGDYLILGHMQSIDVRIGDRLQPGDRIGETGQMVANNSHFHIEYRSVVNGKLTTYDPRDMLNKPANNSVLGASTGAGQVLQASTSRFAELQQEYGIDAPTGPSSIDFDAIQSNFAALRDHAVKYAPMFDLAPEIVVMWALTETAPPYDSWSYSHCHSAGGIIDPGSLCPDNNWQIGYGQQYSVYGGIDEAWEVIYGADDPTKVQQVLQNSATKAGLSQTAPKLSAASLATGNDRFWTMIMGRDQAMSAYLLSQALSGDFQNAQNAGYGNRLFDYACDNGWGAAYCAGSNYRERFANVLNDVVLNWGIAGSGITGQICQVGVPSSVSSCSSVPDELNGLSTDEFVRLINQNMADYKQISACGNVPWEMMAAIHLRETSLDANFTGNNGGSWQLDPPPAGVDAFNFVEAGCWAAKHLADKIEEQFGGEGLGPLRAEMDPTKKEDEYSIKAAFFGYNGTGGWEGNVEKGCTPALDGNQKFNWDCSAYVMNNMDASHTDMCIVGSIDGGSTQNFCDGNDGVWKIYYKLHFSTYGGSGELLVYGGRCSVGNEVIDGYSAPTVAGQAINSQFWAGGHRGIDINNEAGEAVFALTDGEIIDSGWSDVGGYYLIMHVAALGETPELWVYYGHLDPEDLPEIHDGKPMEVLAGQHIATTSPLKVTGPNGNEVPNGDTSGPHLHFDIRLRLTDSPNQADHFNPCGLAIMVNSYPSLQCAANP